MSLSSMDGLTAAIIGWPQFFGKNSTTAQAAGTPHTPWYVAGVTGAGAAPGGGLNGANFTGPSVAGQISMPTAVSGYRSVLLRASATAVANVGGLWVVDRQWGNVPVVTTTTSQAITQPTLPSRDTSASTSGNGVFLALECSSATGNGAPITNTTVSYTNSAGTAGRTATLASWPTAAVAGTFIPFALQAGDQGVRSVQSVTLGTSYVSGAIHLIAFRLLAEIPTPLANVTSLLNFTQLGLPAVWDTSVLQLVYLPSSTAVGAVYGSLTYAQG